MTVEELESSLYIYRGRCLRVIDGDTMEIDFDLGMGSHRYETVRLHGLDTPEIHGVKKESSEFKDGLVASAFVCEKLVPKGLGRTLSRYADRLVTGEPKPLWIETFKDKEGKYGRYVASIWLMSIVPNTEDMEESLICLNDELVNSGLAEYKVY